MEDTALILATHGSTRDKRINQPLFRLAERIAARCRFDHVTPAFLDGQPNIRDIASTLLHRRLIVVPFMTSCGYYTDVVFPRFLRGAMGEVRMTRPIGVHDALPQLVEQRLDHLLSLDSAGRDSAVVVVGHGTRKNVKSCRTTIDLVKQLRGRRPGLRIEFAFIDQNPGLHHVAARLNEVDCLVIPFLMGLGPHTTEDVPRAFGLPSLSDVVFQAGFEFPLVGRRDDGGPSPTVTFDMPVGLYPQWADYCIELVEQELSGMEDPNRESVA